MMEKLIKKLNNRKGFTLIELIVVIAIIGILAAILIPQFTGFTKKAESTQMTVEAKQIATAADALYAEKGVAPNSDAIKKIAGPDITGTIDPIALEGSHITFTYKKTIKTTPYTAVRTSDGAITVTW